MGTGVGSVPPPDDGAAVVGGTAVAGTAVGEDVVPLLAAGVAVAEDPQANNSTTNSKTIALGRCLIICGPDLDFGTVPFLLLGLMSNKC